MYGVTGDRLLPATGMVMKFLPPDQHTVSSSPPVASSLWLTLCHGNAENCGLFENYPKGGPLERKVNEANVWYLFRDF